MPAKGELVLGGIQRGELDALVSEWMVALPIPGMTVGVRSGNALFSAGYGVTREGGAAIQPDTRFRIGSITKVFTACAVARLATDGRFAIHQSISELLPTLRLQRADAGQEITVQQLLSHSSGLDCDLVMDWSRFTDRRRALADAVDEFDAVRSWFAPGHAWAYSNCGYLILGRLIEEVTHQRYADALHALVIGPAGLSRTGFLDAAAAPKGAATGHIARGGRATPVPFAHPLARRPSGGLVSTAADLLQFASLFCRVTSGIFASAAEMMRTPQCRSSWGSDWGCGWELLGDYGREVLGHRGTVNGFQSQLVVVPELDFALALLTNSDRGAVAIRPLADHLLEACAAVRRSPAPRTTMTAAALSRFVGVYESPELRADVTSDGEALLIEAEARAGAYTAFSGVTRQRAWPLGGEVFRIVTGDLAGTCFDFLRALDEPPRYLRYAGRVLARRADPCKR